MDRCRLKRRDEVGRKLGLCHGVGRRRGNRGNVKVMKMEVGEFQWIPTVDAGLGLAVVDSGANIVNGDVASGDEAGEVEKLVEMALCCQWHHDGHDRGITGHGCDSMMMA